MSKVKVRRTNPVIVSEVKRPQLREQRRHGPAPETGEVAGRGVLFRDKTLPEHTAPPSSPRPPALAQSLKAERAMNLAVAHLHQPDPVALHALPKVRIRRNEEQLIADLEVKLAALKNRMLVKSLAQTSPQLRIVGRFAMEINKVLDAPGMDHDARATLIDARRPLLELLRKAGVDVPKARARRKKSAQFGQGVG